MNYVRMMAVVVPVSVVVAACESSVSLEQMPAKIAATYCAKVHECCLPDELVDAGSSFGPDQATCETNLQGTETGRRAKIEAAQSAGRVAYHGDRLAQCLSELSQRSCADMKSAATSRMIICETFLEPRVDAGSFCTQDEECLNGRCLQNAATDAGACATFVGEGASCAGAPCGEGLYCHAGNALCQVREADGQPCALNNDCANGGCNSNPDGGGQKVCGLKGGPNSTCFVTTGCGATGPGAAGPLALLGGLVLIALLARRSGRSSRA